MAKTNEVFPPLFKDAKTLVQVVLDEPYFDKEDPAIPAHFVPGEGNLVVVTGENAGGKSFFRRLVQEMCSMDKIEAINISMEGRRKVSYNPGLAFVYGDESYRATGVLSSSTVSMGIKTMRERTTPNVMIWDEPDIGASDSTAASMGAAIANAFKDPPAHTMACIVITHRKALVEQLLPLKPHFCFLGSKEPPATITDWMQSPIQIRDLDQIQGDAHQRFLAIKKVLDKGGSRGVLGGHGQHQKPLPDRRTLQRQGPCSGGSV